MYNFTQDCKFAFMSMRIVFLAGVAIIIIVCVVAIVAVIILCAIAIVAVEQAVYLSLICCFCVGVSL
jgi:hypothetical protein